MACSIADLESEPGLFLSNKEVFILEFNLYEPVVQKFLHCQLIWNYVSVTFKSQ